jgi:ADP-ribose pyrophosphatase YjhB (NUDIX family)
METLYQQHDRIHLAVDCIIFGFDSKDLKLLCIRRDFEPGKGEWSLMGGFVRREEGTDQAASRVLKELTGLGNIYLEQLQAYGEPERDPAGRVVSIAYYALINSVKFNKLITKDYQAQWFGLDQLPELIFDHRAMVDKALRRLRRRCKNEPVGFELLPAKFTLPQLLSLYEAIFHQEFDKRNFRKKILAAGVLKKLEEKDMKGSRKGAFLYRFQKDQYDAMIRGGTSFSL